MSVLDAIGNTPLVEIRNIWNADKTGVRIMAKLEGSNPGGSVKDRPAYFMLKEALKSGQLKPGTTILEPTSGNTGIGMAMVAAAMGFKIKLTMPTCVSTERQAVLQALGAELELTPGCDRTDGAIKRAHHIMDLNGEHYFMPNQFDNPQNYLSHYHTTGPEIFSQTEGQVDAFVAGMGTTGTLMGCSLYLKEKKPSVRIVGVEPTLNHRIQGLKNMQESIVPRIYDPSKLDRIVSCNDEAAFETTRDLSIREGLFCGISSGAAMWGAMEAARDLPRGSTVVVIFPDRGDRYLSTEVFRSFCAMCPP
ncbi:MAG TPA: cysteine synthase family protein [Deltaproteobacteria bacterium]|jgi:cysteine synthase B|nr:cysteine synthase family protein [Deltaproteobacteria bacterium]HOI06177.1 cysteine synthase family protein [Deltaproteobacteria bacterium]